MDWVTEPPPLPAEPATPRLSCFVCGVPRCGSWLLSDLLDQTGVSDRPHEWFWRDTERANAAAWGTTRDDEYLRNVLAVGTTPNGVFGAKLMWAYVDDFLAPFGLEPFPGRRFVWLRREDVVAQAVSFWKAIATGHWHVWDPPSRDAEYDEAAIEHLVGEIREHDAGWRRWFDASGIEPLELRYEALAADPDAETRRVLAFLGVEAPGSRLEPRIPRQADATNAAWACRYRRSAQIR